MGKRIGMAAEIDFELIQGFLEFKSKCLMDKRIGMAAEIDFELIQGFLEFKSKCLNIFIPNLN
jgi:hypothetical protein